MTEQHPASEEATNRLATETSPYLLQHAHNPVDWYPWGPEALGRAKELDRPVFLSVGYAACHWCHVMAHESFEDPATAEQLNTGFVSIKVDREERPDVDAIYMDAVQQMTGQGGWPMTVFLTPDGRPFYGGTYFPNRRGLGLPAFRDVLAGVTEAWHSRRNEIEESADGLAAAVARGQAAPAWHPAVDRRPDDNGEHASLQTALDAASRTAVTSFDRHHGGWGRAPKFPQAATIEFLLREHIRTGAGEPLEVALRSLDAMAAGGIHDQLGGGFARYATDVAWLVPHFEKMLYDNAQLARVYTHAWLLTREPRYAEVARDTLDFMARELRTPEGAFASSLDADTAGREGATYVWRQPEVEETLRADAALFSAAYGVTAGGNWEGTTILSRVLEDDQLASRFGMTVTEVAETLARSRAALHERRTQRQQPNRDDKVIAAWNGLALAAFADASWALDETRYRTIAEEVGAAAAALLVDGDGRLHRSWNRDTVRGAGTLEDHTHLADGYLALYQATFDERWFSRARDLMALVETHFVAPDGHGFLDTADDSERLLARPRGLQDNAVPSGNAMAGTVFLSLAAFGGEQRAVELARSAVLPLVDVAQRHPTAFAQVLQAIGTIERGIHEVALVGDPTVADARELVVAYRSTYRPWSVLALSDEPDRSSVPLLHGRTRIDGRAAAFVCRAFVCRLPVTEPNALTAELASSLP